jgi:predicted DNA repair protein MutK
MAASNLLTLIDDIATLLDDISVLTKVAAQKTVGVLGDDLALNAEQVIGVAADRELPIVWAVFKGSLLNKLILVPLALLLSSFVPWLVTPLLIFGGLYLCYEGAEKIIEKFFLKHRVQKDDVNTLEIDLAHFEKTKIKGAVTTDFILSAEIIAITLGIVADQPLLKQASVLSITALAMTVFVYGLVGGIVKIDDFGIYLIKNKPRLKKTGLLIVQSAPWIMKLLGVLGTMAMFLVGGGIIVHGIMILSAISTHFLFNGTVGLIAGFLIDGILRIFKKVVGKK